jgi:hypothetical protein
VVELASRGAVDSVGVVAGAFYSHMPMSVSRSSGAIRFEGAAEVGQSVSAAGG